MREPRKEAEVNESGATPEQAPDWVPLQETKLVSVPVGEPKREDPTLVKIFEQSPE